MSVGLSLYLDLFRFAMALIVFFGHASAQSYTAGLTWRSVPFEQPAVIGFFVLSGFVISYVTDQREKDGLTFTISRVSRLYSVLGPALILTAFCDLIGWHFFYQSYLRAPLDIGTSVLPLRYLAGLLMATHLGILQYFPGHPLYFVPGTNGPLWSLSFEVVYYLGFGILLFLRGHKQWTLFIALGLLAGNKILLLAPTWFVGVLVYRFVKYHTISAASSRLLFICSIGLFVITGVPSLQSIWNGLVVFGRPILQDYFVSIVVGLNILGAAGISAHNEEIRKNSEVVHWLGLMTFPLYVCHRPVLQLVASIHVGDVGGVVQTVWILAIVMITTVVVTIISERLRRALRVALTSATQKCLPADAV